MALKDELVRGTAWDGGLRVFAARTTVLVSELQRRQDTFPVATAALGRTATAAAMMGIMLKGEERLTVQIKGDGPIGQIVVDANAAGEVRGYVDYPHVHLPSNSQGKLDVAGVVGRTGHLHVTKDLGLKDPYRGSVPIISGEIAEDFTLYFADSEQTPSAVGLGVLVETDNSVIHAGGFIVQVLPGLAEEHLVRLEQAIAAMPHVTALLDQGETPEGVLRFLLGDDVTIHQTIEPIFQCNCSKERFERALLTIGRRELRSLIDEDGQAETHCHFCNEKYLFDGEELEALYRLADRE